jgi:hypothetical protein
VVPKKTAVSQPRQLLSKAGGSATTEADELPLSTISLITGESGFALRAHHLIARIQLFRVQLGSKTRLVTAKM